jgi:hypothetical protein
VITRLSDQPVGIAGSALSGAATLCWLRGRATEAAALHSRALQAFRDVGDQEGVAWSEVCLAVQAMEQGDPTKAREFAKTALAHHGASLRTQAAACVALGGIAVAMGRRNHHDPERCRRQGARLRSLTAPGCVGFK